MEYDLLILQLCGVIAPIFGELVEGCYFFYSDNLSLSGSNPDSAPKVGGKGRRTCKKPTESQCSVTDSIMLCNANMIVRIKAFIVNSSG